MSQEQVNQEQVTVSADDIQAAVNVMNDTLVEVDADGNAIVVTPTPADQVDAEDQSEEGNGNGPIEVSADDSAPELA